jgi:hypothetical protein
MADITREEQYLSAIANGSTDVPEPVTREEQYLYQIAVNGGGGGGGGASSADKVSYDNTTSGLSATNVQAAIDEVAQGGGGGGSSDIEVIEFSLSGATFSTVLTAGQIKALIAAGKTLIGTASPMSGVTVTVFIAFLNANENGMDVFYESAGHFYTIEMSADTDNDVFSGEVGG